MTVSITSSGIALDGPLVAGEKVAVSVSGLALAAEDKPTLALLARFPDALLASVELAESETAGTWTGELDTATKQTALFFATARADERRDAALELVAGRVSLARLTVPMANSALCPKPDGSPFASPVYVPVPGPPGTGGDPYDQPPEMDGEASAGATDEYARGDHRHPTDTSRASTIALSEGLAAKQDTISDLSAIRSGAAAGATAVQPSALATVATTGNYADLVNKPTIPPASDFVAKTGDQQMQGDLTVSRAGGAPPSDYVMVGNTMGSNATSFIAVNNDGKQLAMSVGVGNDPAIITQKGDIFGAALTPANFGTLALQEGIAPAFSSSSTYAVGDYVTHEGLLYKCTTAVSTAGAWDAADWTAVAVTDEMGADTPLPFDAECEYVTVPAGAYINPGVAAYDASLGIEATFRISSSPAPAEGSFECGFWTGTNSSSFRLYINNASDIKLIRFVSSFVSVSNSPFVGNFGTVSAKGNSFSNGTNSTPVSSSGSVGDPYPFLICGLYAPGVPPGTCSNPVDVSAFKFSFSGVSFRDLVPVRVGQVGYLYDKISGRLFGSAVGSIPLVPGPDKAQPTITTPGRIVELTPAIRYSFASPTPTVSGTAATVACEDRAINDFTVATGITSLAITPPAAVTGRARDFFCRVTLTDSSLPTVTLSGGTIDIGSTEVAGMKQGVNLLMFTEISSGHWLASRRSAS